MSTNVCMDKYVQLCHFWFSISVIWKERVVQYSFFLKFLLHYYRNPADGAFQERGSLSSSEKANRSSGEQGLSTDGMKQQFNMSFNKTSQRSSDKSNGKTHVAQLHAVPGFTHFVDGTPQLQKKEGDRPVPSMKRDVSRTWSFSTGIEAISVKDGLCSEKSHTPDKPRNVNGINVKSHIAKMQPPLGHPSGPNDDKDMKQSSFPSSGWKDASKETVGENSPPLFDEELDENSDAAVSVAALKKAIEQAQESIRLAKMIMQKKRDGMKDGSKARRSKGRSKVEDKKENRTEHVSGGLRENNATEKSQRLDPTFFNGVEGKSAPIPSCSDNLLNAGMAKVETIRESFEAAHDHGDAFTEVDKKFAPSCNQSESLNTDKKVGVENIRQNDGVSEAHGETINFTGLVATVVLESGKVDCNDNLICSKSKALPCLEHMETDKETLEQRELTMYVECPETFSGRAESVASTSQSVQELEESSNEAVEKCQETVGAIKGSVDLAEQLERVLKCSGSMQAQKKIMHEGDRNLKISQESEPPESSDGIADSEKGAKKFVGNGELDFAEHLEMPRSGFNILQNESQSLAEKNMMDQSDIDKKPENVSEWKEDVQDGKCSHEDENGMVLKEQILWFESELQLGEPVEEEMSEREPGIFPGVGEAATKLDMVLEPEIVDEKLSLEHEEDSQTVPRECEENEIALRCIDAAECEAVETLQIGGTINNSEIQNGEIPSDVEEGGSEEHQDKFEFQDSASERDTSEAFDAHPKDSGTIFSDKHGINTRTIFTVTPEPCNVDFNKKEEKYQAVLRDCEENCSLPRETEFFWEVEENEEGKQLRLELNKMPGTDGFCRCASLEKFAESQLNNSFEGFSSNGMSTSVILTNADHQKTQPEDEDIFETTTEIPNIAQEYAANTNMQNFPELRVSTNSEEEEFDKTNAKPDLQQNSENSKESLLSSTLENIDDASAHESPVCRENAKDITSDKEEVKGDLDMNSNERVHVGKQSESVNSEDQSHLSETKCKPKEMDKSDEAEREIKKSGQSMENFGRTSTSEQQDAKGSVQKREIDDDQMQRIEAIKRGREREKDRIAVERAIREARERAFAEARERAERAAVERAAAEVRQRVMAEAREKIGKASIETKPSADKASVEAKLRAERAAVERATAEARERALEKAMSQKTSMEARVQTAKYSTERFSNSSRNDGLKHSFSSSVSISCLFSGDTSYIDFHVVGLTKLVLL